MALKHKWQDKAKTDLNDTLDYVFNRFGERTANKVFSEVSEVVDMLCAFPDAGSRYGELQFQGNIVRIFHMEKSSIIYSHDDETLIILALWNNRSANPNIPVIEAK